MDGYRFRFGLFADVQYADQDPWRGRKYRDALGHLESCIAAWRGESLDFAVQLGDLIDGADTLEETRRDFDAIEARLDGFEGPWLHVIGNHCLALPREELQERLRLESSWFATSHSGWRFVVLDSLDLSVCGRTPGSSKYEEALSWLDRHSVETTPWAEDWNGGFGPEQLAWLENQLADAHSAGERVVVLCHNPLIEEASEARHLAWNAAEALKILDGYACVHAFMSGHHHDGGYAIRRGVHHLGIPAMVEAPVDNAWAIVSVFEDRLLVEGRGSVPSRALEAED